MNCPHFLMDNNNNNIYKYILIISLSACSYIPIPGRAQNQNEIQLANEYLLKGDKAKALELYRDLSKNDNNIPFIHNNYINVMLDAGAVDEAQNYLKRILRKDPDNIQFRADVGIVYVRSGDLARADKVFKELIAENRGNVSRIKMLSDYLANRSLAEYSIIALNEGRQTLGNPYLFCLELASLYRIKGQKEKMVQEYLTYVMQSSANTQYVKNVMQVLLTQPEELTSLEKILYERVQKYPDMEVYSDLLVWVTIQQKNFYAAFIQARAYDRRNKKLGEKCMEVARVALDNEDYENALVSYNYVVKEYPGGPFYLQARLGLIRTRETRIRNTYPVQGDSVRALISEYDKFIREHTDNTNALEAQRSQALLWATYLDEKSRAVELLNALIANPHASLQLKSKAKLDLGDIFLLSGESWESALLYAQVEKALKESPLGYEAKLKNAKLSYYKGDFRLAQEHLDILKEATTREIANDAMELSMRIKENIAFDSAGLSLQAYATVELLLYQNKTDQALDAINALKEGRIRISKEEAFLRNITFPQTPDDHVWVAFANHAILDDVYWLEANLRMQRGEFDKALGILQKILDEYSDDILADDAYFLQAEIYDRQLVNKDRAIEMYREFLNRYPGSVYAAEARMRYRVLRGDFADTPLN
ncbi:tetratricopeptide repeat protein [Oscillatoria amoena NRMC-F 0135]|nr:tetratricopeptide repeat protein [Oscillatoria amoena NRMC-F 0135]